MERDPVCGVDVDPSNATGSSKYEGTTYYFCSPGCRRQFNKDPKRYLGQGASQGQHEGAEGHHNQR